MALDSHKWYNPISPITYLIIVKIEYKLKIKFVTPFICHVYPQILHSYNVIFLSVYLKILLKSIHTNMKEVWLY